MENLPETCCAYGEAEKNLEYLIGSFSTLVVDCKLYPMIGWKKKYKDMNFLILYLDAGIQM